MSSPSGVQVALVIVGVVCVATALVLSRRYRREHGIPPGRWWIGRPASTRPSVLIGWGCFVAMTWLLSLTQPLIAIGLLCRAWLLRAVFLRKPRK